MSEQMGVYKLHKLARTNKGFDVDVIVALERDLHVIQNEYAESVNSNSSINGLLYEKDKKATKLYWEKKPFKNVKEYADFEEVENEKPKRGRKPLTENE